MKTVLLELMRAVEMFRDRSLIQGGTPRDSIARLAHMGLTKPSGKVLRVLTI